MMFDFRPHWGAAMTLVSAQRTHLRSGWAAGLGFHPWCQRGRSGGYLKNAVEGAWVTVDEIKDRDIHDDESGTKTCERCCFQWLKDYESNN